MSSLHHLLDDTASVSRPPSTPYNPIRRTPARSVLIPISRVELAQFQHSTNPLRKLSVNDSNDSRPLPSAPTDLIDKSEVRPNEIKRPASDELLDTRGHKTLRNGQNARVVANHYNARPNIDRVTRNESPIIGLKNFNNWIKSVLISKYGRRDQSSGPRVKVLDLGCGKGGDLQKWARAGTDEYIGIDLAEVSIEQARDRWEHMRTPRFRAAFFAADCFETSIDSILAPIHYERPFDVVSMQFCLHYAFETEEKARTMLSNVVRYLRPGGTFIGTIPDATGLQERLDAIDESQEALVFGNDVYGIKFDNRSWSSPFGHRYTFFLQDAVEEVPEYLVVWDSLVSLAAEYGLEPVYHADFQQIFVDEQGDQHFSQLLKRMRVINHAGETEMDENQWEAATLYLGFAFRLTGNK